MRRKGRFVLGETEGAEEDGVNPMHYLPNLPDVMLVLAVALLVALISFWNVDVSSTSAFDTSQLQPVEGDLEQGEPVDSLSGEDYREVGTVYQDVATGEMYLLAE
jgi:hypothetical protein